MPIEWWVVLATLAGPIVAVQTQKWIERAGERHRKRVWIFNALMANRAARLSDDFVRALNLIDIDFLPRRVGDKKARAVIAAWRALFGELGNGPDEGADLATWNRACDDRVVDLLVAMSACLGYRFTGEEVRRGIYYPKGHVEREQAAMAILHGLRKVVDGTASLPMRITEAPNPPETAKLQAQLTEKMATAYGDDGALKVRIIDPTPPTPRPRR